MKILARMMKILARVIEILAQVIKIPLLFVYGIFLNQIKFQLLVSAGRLESKFY